MQDKVVFITKRNHKITDSRIEVIDSINPLLKYLDGAKKLGKDVSLDSENNSLNPFIAEHLLLQLGDKENRFVVDRTSIDNEFMLDYLDLSYLGVNLQYDYSILAWNEDKRNGIEPQNLKDLMVADQILNRGSGYSNSLEAIHKRRLGIQYPEDKGIGKSFTKMNKKSILEDKHILYAAADIGCLHEIYEVQKQLIAQTNLNRRVYDIGFPLIPILGDMMLNGSELNKEEWNNILQENKALKIKYEKEMDSILVNLGYKTKIRNKEEIQVLDLFGNTYASSNQNVKNINYSSTPQVLKIFEYFKLPIPMMKDKETFQMKPSVGAEALEKYQIINYGHKLTTFINTLLLYKGVEKRINSFGLNFLYDIYPDPNKSIDPKRKNNLIRGYYNPKTNKVHTKYKQEFTANGRLSSGSDSKNADGKQKSNKKRSEVFFNSQQIPKEIKYHQCFRLEDSLIHQGWFRTTFDLSGAELVILGALSGDTKLLRLQKEDLHSYLATAAYTKIVKYIINNMDPLRQKQELHDLFRANKVFESLVVTDEDGKYVRDYTTKEKDDITQHRIEYALKNKAFIVDKKKGKDLRDSFKNVVYGVSYGSKADKVAETLNIAKDYAQMVLNAMEEELPVAFGYLKRISQQAIKNGYIIFNTRTNSRHIFKQWLNAQAYQRDLSNAHKSEIERAAKNYGISGTQADMIKESMVECNKYLKENKIPHKWIFQVHDELVIDHKGKEVGQILADISLSVCNKYLNGLAEMGVSVETGYTWNK